MSNWFLITVSTVTLFPYILTFSTKFFSVSEIIKFKFKVSPTKFSSTSDLIV